MKRDDLVYSLRSDATIETDSTGSVALRCRDVRVGLGAVGPGVRSALEHLRGDGGTRAELVGLAAPDGPGAGTVVRYALAVLERRGLLRTGLRVAGELWVRVTPRAGTPVTTSQIDETTRYRLSRFALIRRVDSSLYLESPLTGVSVELRSAPAQALVTALAAPHSAATLAAIGPADVTVTRLLLGLLVGAEAVVADDSPEPAELWEFHDLLFLTRSRLGRHDQPYGSTSPGTAIRPPEPAVRKPYPGPCVELARPDLAGLEASDPPFARVLESRQSERRHGATPITVGQLGELLFRVARVRGVVEADPARPDSFAVTDRPYPSGGATYDLEIYLTVHRCTGLAPGLHHYDPAAHVLRQVSTPTAQTEALLAHAQRSAVLPEPPQILLTFASRFARVQWRYASMGHALTCKNVGVLQQTICLTATAMGLAACPLGGGDSDVFVAAAGTDYYEETSVGELILGSLPQVEER